MNKKHEGTKWGKKQNELRTELAHNENLSIANDQMKRE